MLVTVLNNTFKLSKFNIYDLSSLASRDDFTLDPRSPYLVITLRLGNFLERAELHGSVGRRKGQRFTIADKVATNNARVTTRHQENRVHDNTCNFFSFKPGTGFCSKCVQYRFPARPGISFPKPGPERHLNQFNQFNSYLGGGGHTDNSRDACSQLGLPLARSDGSSSFVSAARGVQFRNNAITILPFSHKCDVSTTTFDLLGNCYQQDAQIEQLQVTLLISSVSSI